MLCRQLLTGSYSSFSYPYTPATIRLILQKPDMYTIHTANHTSQMVNCFCSGGSQRSPSWTFSPCRFILGQIPSGNVGVGGEAGAILTPGLSPWSKGHVNQPSSPPVALISKSTSVETWEHRQYIKINLCLLKTHSFWHRIMDISWLILLEKRTDHFKCVA